MALLLGEEYHPLRLQDLTQPLLLQLCDEALWLQEDEVPLLLGEGEVTLVLGEKDKILFAVAAHVRGRDDPCKRGVVALLLAAQVGDADELVLVDQRHGLLQQRDLADPVRELCRNYRVCTSTSCGGVGS